MISPLELPAAAGMPKRGEAPSERRTRSSRRRALALLVGPLSLLLLAGGAGCSDENNLVPLDWSLNRMKRQQRYTDFQAGPGFEDGRVMQTPPADTVDRDRVIGSNQFTLGIHQNGDFLQTYPIVMSRELIELGQNRYNRTCAACHGILGTAEAEVAHKMDLVKPPSLLREDLLDAPVGRLYQVATFGYGLMPGYDYHLDDVERWAVVAYVKALQRSQTSTLDSLPPELQRRFRSEVR